MITKAEWKNIRGSQPQPDQIMLSIKGDASRSMTVRWRTDTSIDNGFALYREKGTEEWMKAAALKHPFTTDMDESHFFFADMANLKPATEYEYTCGNEEIRSEAYSFRTADKNAEKFSFVCLSDIQAGDAMPPADYSVLRETLTKFLNEHHE